jgi:hypothetical protein
MPRTIYILLIALFIILAGFSSPGKDDKIKDELKDPVQRHSIMNQIMNNSEYMSEFMNGVLENKKAQNIMMDQMFLVADNDSAFTAKMYQHMKDYNDMMDHMRYMMNGRDSAMHSYGMRHHMN